jgi:hypothetical protein
MDLTTGSKGRERGQKDRNRHRQSDKLRRRMTRCKDGIYEENKQLIRLGGHKGCVRKRWAQMRENPAISDWVPISGGCTEGLLGGWLAQRQAALRG